MMIMSWKIFFFSHFFFFSVCMWLCVPVAYLNYGTYVHVMCPSSPVGKVFFFVSLPGRSALPKSSKWFMTPPSPSTRKVVSSHKSEPAPPTPPVLYFPRVYAVDEGWWENGFLVFGALAFIIVVGVCVCRVLPFIYLFIYYYNLGAKSIGSVSRPPFYSNQFELEIQPPRHERRKCGLTFFFALC